MTQASIEHKGEGMMGGAAGSLGFHWRPGVSHLRWEQIHPFVPHLEQMGARWLVLRAPCHAVAGAREVAQGLRRAGIEPLLHLLPDAATTPSQARQAASDWVEGGVRWIAFDEQANSATRWGFWEPRELPQRYARWLFPFLGALSELEGVIPLFPPLAPGGEFWDHSFLAQALAEMRRLEPPWLERMGVACVNDVAGRPITWGQGGARRWGESVRRAGAGQEDQIGFRNWEWVRETAEAQLERPVAVCALSTRLTPSPDAALAEVVAIRQALMSEAEPPVLGAAFWVLTEEVGHDEAWLLPDGTPRLPKAIAAMQQPLNARRSLDASALPATVRLLGEGRVKSLPLEAYLRGVLPAAMGAGAPLEALKAQAVAARSYAVRALLGPRHSGEGADLCAGEHCQPWQELPHARTDRALRETEGLLAGFDGQVINAFSHACCGGRTRSSEEAWHVALPYCPAVPCAEAGGVARGHGVGLCRRGALRMAQQGAAFVDILAHYFPGVTLLDPSPAARAYSSLR